MKAKVVPWSSTVGTGLVLMGDDGKVFGQLALFGIALKDGKPDKALYMETVQKIADAINGAGDSERDDDFHCEACGKAIRAGDKYTVTLDGCYLCEEDAPSFQDCADYWDSHVAHSREELETAAGCAAALAHHVATGGSPDDKPLTVME